MIEAAVAAVVVIVVLGASAAFFSLAESARCLDESCPWCSEEW